MTLWRVTAYPMADMVSALARADRAHASPATFHPVRWGEPRRATSRQTQGPSVTVEAKFEKRQKQ